MQMFHAKINRINNLTHNVRELELKLIEPSSIEFKAGQWISLDVWNPQLKQHVQRRYSIASPPNLCHQVKLLFNRVPGGLGSSYLFSLELGHDLQFQGPGGSFFLNEVLNRDLVFVATGTGIAPFCSMLGTRLEQPNAGKITLFWGLRYQRDLYHQTELESLERLHPNFNFITTLSRPQTGWKGPNGRVTALVEERISTVKNVEFYLCGNGDMIRDVAEVVRKKGLCPVHTEKFHDETTTEIGD